MTILADLSIILFMVTATDLSNAETRGENPQHEASMIATAEPIAVYRPNSDTVSLGTWLASQPADSRQRLTILIRHSDKDVEPAIAEGLDLVRQAETAGRSARLIVESGEKRELVVYLAYDSDPHMLARKLLVSGRKPGPE